MRIGCPIQTTEFSKTARNLIQGNRLYNRDQQESNGFDSGTLSVMQCSEWLSMVMYAELNKLAMTYFKLINQAEKMTNLNSLLCDPESILASLLF